MSKKEFFIKTISMTEKSCPFCEGIVEVYTLKGEETRLYSSCVSCGMLTTGDINSSKKVENQDEKISEEFRRYKFSKKVLGNKKGDKHDDKQGKRVRAGKKKKKSK